MAFWKDWRMGTMDGDSILLFGSNVKLIGCNYVFCQRRMDASLCPMAGQFSSLMQYFQRPFRLCFHTRFFATNSEKEKLRE